jgi:hypothetical protein
MCLPCKLHVHQVIKHWSGETNYAEHIICVESNQKNEPDTMNK